VAPGKPKLAGRGVFPKHPGIGSWFGDPACPGHSQLRSRSFVDSVSILHYPDDITVIYRVKRKPTTSISMWVPPDALARFQRWQKSVRSRSPRSSVSSYRVMSPLRPQRWSDQVFDGRCWMHRCRRSATLRPDRPASLESHGHPLGGLHVECSAQYQARFAHLNGAS